MSYELRVQRVLNATVEAVFEAFTDAEAQKVWYALGPDGPEDLIVETRCDLRVGGEWVTAWGHNRDELYRERNVFQVIERPRRLVMTSTAWSPDGQRLHTTVEVTFDDLDGKTQMTVVQSGFPTAEVRDFFASTAWLGAFDRIESYLRMNGAVDVNTTKGKRR